MDVVSTRHAGGRLCQPPLVAATAAPQWPASALTLGARVIRRPARVVSCSLTALRFLQRLGDRSGRKFSAMSVAASGQRRLPRVTGVLLVVPAPPEIRSRCARAAHSSLFEEDFHSDHELASWLAAGRGPADDPKLADELRGLAPASLTEHAEHRPPASGVVFRTAPRTDPSHVGMRSSTGRMRPRREPSSTVGVWLEGPFEVGSILTTFAGSFRSSRSRLPSLRRLPSRRPQATLP
jgi:hypothetical protein